MAYTTNYMPSTNQGYDYCVGVVVKKNDVDWQPWLLLPLVLQ
jgi:hypothetical protein